MALNGCSRTAEGLPCLACDQLGQAEFEVAQAELALECARQKRRAVRQRANEYHDPFSRRLPVEISSRILLMCLIPLPTIENFEQGPHVWVPEDVRVDRSFKPQLILGSVCRRWRQIVWSTPQFWNMIHLFLSIDSPSYHATIFKDWIQRSGELPLYIYVHFTDPHFAARNANVRVEGLPLLLSIVATLNTCVHRWTLVELSLPAVYMTILRGNGSASTKVKGLSLSSYSAQDSNAISPSFTSNAIIDFKPRAAPERLTLSGIQLHFVHMDWSKLTVFSGEALLLNECIEVLRRSPRLTRCTFDFIRGEEDESYPLIPPASPVIHQALREFMLINADSFVFTCMTCPNLINLDINTSSSQFTTHLSDFVSRSACSLQSLSADLDSADQEKFLDFLKVTPTVKTLEITHFNDGFFDALANTMDNDPDDPFLPNLRQLMFFGLRSFRWSAVSPLLPTGPPQEGKHRRPLRTIVLQVEHDPNGCLPDREEPLGPHGTDFIDEELLERILDCIKNGFDIQVIEPGGESLIDASMEHYGLGMDDE